MTASSPSRARRLIAGWSASVFQMVLGLTQQVALIPVFLHFWSGEVLAAWLVIYAAGNLILIADSGLQFRAINRFLAFKSSIDCDGRTARFYAALLRVFLSHPLLTFKVVAAIHWQALRLWIKRVPLQPRPPAPARELTIVSIGKPS